MNVFYSQRIGAFFLFLMCVHGGCSEGKKEKSGGITVTDTAQDACGGPLIDGGAPTETDTTKNTERDTRQDEIDTAEGVAETLLIDDMEDGDIVNEVGGYWVAYHDHHEGGVSEVWPPALQDGPFETDAPGYGDAGYAVHLVGTTGDVIQWDFVGMHTLLHQDADCPLATPTDIDMHHYDGVQFLAKGQFEGGLIRLVLHHLKDGTDDNCSDGTFPDTLTNWGDYYYDFTYQLVDEWSLIRIRFEDLVQGSWGGISVEFDDVLSHLKTLSWHYEGAGGGIDLWVDNLALFKDLPEVDKVYPEIVVTGETAFTMIDEPSDPAVGTMTDIAVADQTFPSAKQIAVDSTPRMLWDVMLHAPSETSIDEGDILHADFSARCVSPPEGEESCRMTFVFVQNSEPWTVSGSLAVSVGSDWTRFSLPFPSNEDYEIGEAYAGFNLGFPAQTVAIGDFSVINYGDTVTLDALDKTQITYDGRESDAPWRSAALERIETHRKGDLAVVVQDSAGVPVPDAAVSVDMTRHRFGFGTAIRADDLKHNFSDVERTRFTDKVSELFNTVVPENTLKWKAMAGDWGDVFGLDLATWTVDWADAMALPVRGHALMWPGWNNLPDQLKRDYDARIDADGTDSANSWLKNTVASHVQTTATAMAGRLSHWDVINEPFSHHDLMDILGQDVMVDWFRLAREADPNAKLFVNDFSVIAPVTTYNATRERLQEVVDYLIAEDAPIDGIGIQGHFFGADLASPERIYQVLESFAPFDKEIWITEFDMSFYQDEEPELVADFTRDLLTVVFSHPLAGGFMMWGFWDGSRWDAPVPIYDIDWNEKPSGAIYKDLVYNQWWTNESGITNADGRYTTRGFYGDYRITATVGENTITKEITHAPGAPEIIMSIE